MSRVSCSTEIVTKYKAVTKPVCNIKSILVIRSIFGHRCDLPLPTYVQVVCNVYYGIISTLLVYSKLYCCDGLLYAIWIVEIIEYFSYYILSFHTHSRYLTDYYRFAYITDGSMYSKKVFTAFQKCIHFIVPTIVIVVLLSTSQFIIFPEKVCSACGLWGIGIFMVYRVGISVGRIPMLLVFGLLYCRVKIFTKDLLTNGFMKPMATCGDKQQYLDMYISICKGIAKMDYPMKIMIFVNICSYFQDILFIIHTSIIKYTAYGNPESNYVAGIAICINLIFNGFFTFFPALILEVVSEDLEKVKIYIADQLITCTDEQRRGEMQQLLQYIKNQPLSYSVWRVIPINATLPITALTLAVNYLVCMLQFTNAFGTAAPKNNVTKT